MAIPELSKQNILEALKWIDGNGVPDHKQSKEYDLITEDGKKYPPKYVIEVQRYQLLRQMLRQCAMRRNSIGLCICVVVPRKFCGHQCMSDHKTYKIKDRLANKKSIKEK